MLYNIALDRFKDAEHAIINIENYNYMCYDVKKIFLFPKKV